MTAKRLSFWVGPALYIGVVAGHFADSAPLSILVSAVLALYVALEFRRIAGSQRIAGAVLIGLGAAMALYAGSFVDSMLVGLQRSQSFFLLFSAITWLHIPANHSPSLQAAQEAAMRQAPGWRFAAIMGAAHVLSSVLNMAGISLLSGVVSRQTDAGLRRRLTCALACGFTAASCWTPFYIAVTVVLSVRPDVGWSDLAPMGLVVALALLLLGWIIDRVSRGRTGGAEIQTAGAARAIWDWRAVAIPAGLFGCVVFLVEGRGLPIPIALGVLAPPYAAAWIAVQAHGRIDAVGAIGDLVYRTAKTMPNLRNEVFLFLAANILGTGIAAAIPAESVEAVFGMLDFPFPTVLVLVLAVILGLAMAGLHPVIVFVAIGQVIPPEVLGLSPALFGSALLAMWGIGAAASPFSGVSLYLSRIAGVPSWRVAWIWNGPYVMAATLIVAVIVIMARLLGID